MGPGPEENLGLWSLGLACGFCLMAEGFGHGCTQGAVCLSVLFSRSWGAKKEARESVNSALGRQVLTMCLYSFI